MHSTVHSFSFKFLFVVSVADPGPGSGAFLTAGSGMERNEEAGYRITIADVIADGGKANSSKKTCAGIFFYF